MDVADPVPDLGRGENVSGRIHNPESVDDAGGTVSPNFSEFLHDETSLQVYTALNIINSVFGVTLFGSFVISRVDFLFLAPAILRLILVLPLNVYQMRLLRTHNGPMPRSVEPDYYIPNVWLGDFIILLFTLANGLTIMVYSFPGECASNLCPQYAHDGALLGYFMQILCMMAVVKCHHSSTSWIAIFFQALFTFILAVRVDAELNFYVGLILALVFEMLVVIDKKRYLFRTHATMLEIEVTLREKILSEHKRTMEEMRSTELRYLIGNVAHDLKTPLQSFSLELDTLLLVKNENNFNSDHVNFHDPAAQLRDVLVQVDESVSLLKSVCSFMLMTINRAIDHTKTTSGITLVPTYDTINLNETMSWVSQCIGKSGKVPLIIAPIPKEVSMHVITDNQWLLENLLCLVSNARKFTSSGAVKVSCSLVDSTFLDSQDDQDVANAFLPPSSESDSFGMEDVVETDGADVRAASNAAGYTCLGHDGGGDACDAVELTRSREAGRVASVTVPAVHVEAGSRARQAPALTVEVGGDGGTSSSSTDRVTLSPMVSSQKILLFEVEDTGIGIPSEKRSALFHPFEQAQRRAGGTGLGLFSMANRIAALGGACGVSDRYDGKSGARFWFTLPYRPDDSQHDNFFKDDFDLVSPNLEGDCDRAVTDERACSVPCPLRPRPSSSPLTSRVSLLVPTSRPITDTLLSQVLLVEDSLMIQKTIVRAFQREHIRVDVAVNGAEALDMLAEKSYSLVLMDIQMPVMDGLEAMKRIRQLSYESNRRAGVTGNDVIVVGVSANSDSESEQEARDAGMNDFLAKPLSLLRLKQCLEQINCQLVSWQEKQVV